MATDPRSPLFTPRGPQQPPPTLPWIPPYPAVLLPPPAPPPPGQACGTQPRTYVYIEQPWLPPPPLITTTLAPQEIPGGGNCGMRPGTWQDKVVPWAPLNISVTTLLGQDIKPFAQYQWALTSLPIQPPKSWVWSDIAVQGGSGPQPFALYQWPLTTLPVQPDRSWINDISLALLTAIPPLPNNKYDWPLTVLPKLPDPSFVRPTDIVLLTFTLPATFGRVPFTTTASPIQPDRSWIQGTNLPLTTFVASTVPFHQYQWSLTYQYTTIIDDGVEGTNPNIMPPVPYIEPPILPRSQELYVYLGPSIGWKRLMIDPERIIN